jgi:hypothetical protein
MALLPAPTLQSLINNIRNMLSQPDPTNSNWTDVEITSYINEGIRMYFSELVMIDEGNYVNQVDLDIQSNVETIDLPADFFKVRALYKAVTQGYLILPYRNNLTEGYYTDNGTNSETYLPYYYFRDNQLVIRPVPNFTQTAGFRLEYIQFPDTLVNGGDQLSSQIAPLFRQVIEMYAVYKAKIKESLVSGVRTHEVAAENLADLYKQFKETMQMRSKNPVAVIPFNPESEGL